MGREERQWEQPARSDDYIGRGARGALFLVYLIVQVGTVLVLGGGVAIVALGAVLGIAAAAGVAKLILSNQKPQRRPPKQLL